MRRTTGGAGGEVGARVCGGGVEVQCLHVCRCLCVKKEKEARPSSAGVCVRVRVRVCVCVCACVCAVMRMGGAAHIQDVNARARCSTHCWLPAPLPAPLLQGSRSRSALPACTDVPHVIT